MSFLQDVMKWGAHETEKLEALRTELKALKGVNNGLRAQLSNTVAALEIVAGEELGGLTFAQLAANAVNAHARMRDDHRQALAKIAHMTKFFRAIAFMYTTLGTVTAEGVYDAVMVALDDFSEQP